MNIYHQEGYPMQDIQTCQATGKPCYDKRSAETAKNRRARSRRRGKYTELRVYQCPECNYWHLTHKRALNIGRKK